MKESGRYSRSTEASAPRPVFGKAPAVEQHHSGEAMQFEADCSIAPSGPVSFCLAGSIQVGIQRRAGVLRQRLQDVANRVFTATLDVAAGRAR